MSVIPSLSHLFYHSPFTLHIYVCIYIYILIFFFCCAGSSSLHRLSLVVVSRGSSLVAMLGLLIAVASLDNRAQALGARASVVAARKLSSCGAWAQLLWGMWNLPGPGIEPMYPALAGEFLSTVPPGKPYGYIFYTSVFTHIYSFPPCAFCELDAGSVWGHQCENVQLAFKGTISMMLFLGSCSKWRVVGKRCTFYYLQGFAGGSDGKASACNVGDPGSTAGSGRSLEKGMAIHSSTLAWKISWMEEPGRLQSMGLQRAGHDWATSLFFLFHCWQRRPDCCCHCGFLSL